MSEPSFPHHNDPAVMEQVARHGTPLNEISGKPHERDLDQPSRFAYRKPWERRRRLYWIAALVTILVFAALLWSTRS